MAVQGPAWCTPSSGASASEAALDFWEERLAAEADGAARDESGVAFEDPEGLRHRLVVSTVDDAPLVAEHPEVPAEHALQGFDAVRAFAIAPEASRDAARGDAGIRGGQTRRV